MKPLLSTIGAFAFAATALELTKRENPAVLSIPFQHVQRQGARASTSSRSRRDSVSVDTGLNGNSWAYWANFTLGTPPTKFWAEFDTGSADLIMLTSEVEDCQKDKSKCFGGFLNTNKSSTLEWTSVEVEGNFGSGETWSGEYAQDVLEIEGAKLKGFQFAAATDFAAGNWGHFNIFGIGLWTLEHDGKGYNNLPYALAEAGYINTPAYSVWLESRKGGNFLFGAVDKSKYKGPLVTLPIAVNNRPKPQAKAQTKSRDRFIVPLSGFGITNKGKSETKGDYEPRPVLLDTGNADSYISEEMTVWLLDRVDGLEVTDESSPYKAIVGLCDGDWKDITVDFSFAELTINVPLSSLFAPWKGLRGVDDGKPRCAINLWSTNEPNSMSLGEDFLRNAYVVYDLANFEISLAAINKDGGKEDIHEIGTKSVPGAVQATEVPQRYEDFEIDGLTAAAPTDPTVVTVSFVSNYEELTSASETQVKNQASKTSGSENSSKTDDEGSAPGIAAPVILPSFLALCALSAIWF